MSRALSLVRFRDKSIYKACYDGTIDTLSPWLISDKKLKNQFNGSVFLFNDKVADYKHFDESSIRRYAEPVQIYIDYGSCFMWNGTASKSELYITSPLSYNSNNIRHDIDLWVYEYFINHGYDTRYIVDKIRDPLFKKEKYKVGEYVYFIRTTDEIIWRPGMLKPDSTDKPIPKKIIHIDYTNNGIMYQVKGCHFNEGMIGTIVFDTYDDAVNGLNKRDEERSNRWKNFYNRS